MNTTLQHKGLYKLMGLDYTIQYKNECENVVADALSRREEHTPVNAENMAVAEIIPTWIEEMKESYEDDEWAQEVLKGIQEQTDTSEVTVHQGVIR
jgi:hypothetical protein